MLSLCKFTLGCLAVWLRFSSSLRIHESSPVRSGGHTGYGAWLAPKETFLAKNASTVVSCEDATLHYANEQGPMSMMTRDVLDFMVIHLSPLTRGIGEYSEDRTLQKDVEERIQTYTDELQKASERAGTPLQQAARTLVVIPYVNRPNTAAPEDFHAPNSLRTALLNATVWSVGAQFPKLLIATCSSEDAADAQRLGYPIWRTVVMQGNNSRGRDCQHLYGWALEEAQQILESQEGSLFDFVYFTEADQVLHTRNLGQLFDSFKKHPFPTINSGQTGPVLVVHRLSAVPHLQSFSPDVQLLLQSKSKSNFQDMGRWIDRWEGKEVLRLPLMTGSCCENSLEPLVISRMCFFDMEPDCRPDDKENDFALIQFGNFGIPFINVEQLRPSEHSVAACKPSAVMEPCG